MPDVGVALRGRTFGIPNGILLVAVAVGIWWFFIRGKTGPGAKTPQAAAAGSQLQSGYGLGYAQGLQASQAGQPPPGGAPPAAQQKIRVTPAPGRVPPGVAPLMTLTPNAVTPGGSAGGRAYTIVAVAPAGQVLTVNGSPQQVQSPDVGTFTAIPVNYLGQTLYINSIDATPTTEGQGVGGPVRKHHIGSRSSSPHDAHPLIGAPVRYAHYVRVGGPSSAAAHHANVQRVAAQAGVHPARVAMLNPVPTGLLRIA